MSPVRGHHVEECQSNYSFTAITATFQNAKQKDLKFSTKLRSSYLLTTI